MLPADAILANPPSAANGEVLGASREGRPLVGHRFGRGDRRVSLIAGCHADEPVGPELLRRLVTYLAGLPPEAPELTRWRWAIVPDANPDSAARNATWISRKVSIVDPRGSDAEGYELVSYLREARRELPGDDVEFGFPRSSDDLEARPENRAIAAFLDRQGPFDVHGSLHGMGFAAGPWFLLERSWAPRTRKLRDALRLRVGDLGYRLHDVDRAGEKGFHRIDEGFTSRPDSRAMRDHFLALGDEEMADRFRPSSMEYVRSAGEDPLTFVSEMPLFVMGSPLSRQPGDPAMPTGTEGRLAFLSWAERRLAEGGEQRLRKEAARLGIAPMSIRDQEILQLAFVRQSMATVAARS